VFAIEDAIARRKQHYLDEFGVEPMMRGALHAGHLIVGEMGDVKREIVMLGDTMNTAAKIVDVCRRSGQRYIVSAALLDRIAAVPAAIRAQALGAVAIPGKETGMVLFDLTRDFAGTCPGGR
jgi:adenylate cyclase